MGLDGHGAHGSAVTTPARGHGLLRRQIMPGACALLHRAAPQPARTHNMVLTGAAKTNQRQCQLAVSSSAFLAVLYAYPPVARRTGDRTT